MTSFASGTKVRVHGHDATVRSVHGNGKKVCVTIDATGRIRYVAADDVKADVCVVCDRAIEPAARFFDDGGRPIHMLCDATAVAS